MSKIQENLEKVRNQVKNTCFKAKKDPKSIKLIAVSKKIGINEIIEAYKANQISFGENYAQELRNKNKEISSTYKKKPSSTFEIEWHFIGHLQKNKVKYVIPIVKYIHTIDSFELAQVINNKAIHKINCLIEINIGDEKTKSGIDPKQAIELANKFKQLTNLNLCGLMIIPPYNPNPETSRPYFKKLKELLEQINKTCDLANPLTELSMGMSHDFEIAIEEGATMIRVGTAIFGERQ